MHTYIHTGSTNGSKRTLCLDPTNFTNGSSRILKQIHQDPGSMNRSTSIHKWIHNDPQTDPQSTRTQHHHPPPGSTRIQQNLLRLTIIPFFSQNIMGCDHSIKLHVLWIPHTDLITQGESKNQKPSFLANFSAS